MQKICSDCGAKTNLLYEECLECGHSQGESTLTWFSFALPIGVMAFLFLCLLIVNQDEKIKGASEVQFQGFNFKILAFDVKRDDNFANNHAKNIETYANKHSATKAK